MKNNTEQKKAAKEFVEYWKDKGYEKGESQPFWLSLLRDVLGVEQPEKFITFEDKVMLDHTSFIDGYIPSTHILIEQKSCDKNLRKPIKQSDGTLLSPFQQAKRYSAELPYSQRPRWIVTCNFKEFLIYDMEKPTGEPESILLESLPKEYYRLKFLTDAGSELLKREMEISIKAGEIVGVLYDKLLAQYKNPDENSLKSLNALCVRLVFCLYAEDADIFGDRMLFHDYLKDIPVSGIREALVKLFKILDTPEKKRDKYLADDNPMLAAFPYVNGGLFANEEIEIPPFTEELKDLLLHSASENFDWSNISPTIFGAVFESTLNPETRRSGGMHYTSIENIHKVIDPLFLDELKQELDGILELKTLKTKNQRLKEYTEKLSKLKFLDPACGSGNFLTETYISLRRLENRTLEEIHKGQIVFDTGDLIKVSIGQFYGIEINDFAVTVAKTALWIAESQMMKETEGIIHTNLDFLPLKSYANIVESNALRIDWNEVIPKEELNYIMGNPPFVGASKMSKTQKEEAVTIFGKGKRINSIDYVGAWYHKAGYYIQNTTIRCAFVSTNSITQGEQVFALWNKLMREYKLCIDFAHRTFKWNSESNEKAAVHCVIIGFSQNKKSQKYLYDGERMQKVKNINPYLIEAPDILIESRSCPICDVPKMTAGNKPSDGGNLILSEEEKNSILKNDNTVFDCIKRYVGAKDFINNNEKRYCLWLKDISPNVYRKNAEIMRRLQAVREMRLKSSAEPTRALADKPYIFFSTPQTDNNYLCIPEVSSENRRYIPIGFMNKNIIASNKLLIIPNATLFHFGILTSNIHMAWTRAVCGRLEMRYQYSGSVVYNNFPWCNPTDEQKRQIEQTAQAILDARALYPDSSLADLYDELTMPPELRRAHQANDRAVMQAYGFDVKTTTESACVAELMKMYQRLISRK